MDDGAADRPVSMVTLRVDHGLRSNASSMASVCNDSLIDDPRFGTRPRGRRDSHAVDVRSKGC